MRTACSALGWVRGAAAAAGSTAEQSPSLGCPSCPPAGRVSAMAGQAQWDGGAGFGAGCRREGGKGAGKGTGMRAAMAWLCSSPPAPRHEKASVFTSSALSELFSGPSVLEILGRAISSNFQETFLALRCSTDLLSLFHFFSIAPDQTGKMAALQLDACRA